MTRNSLLPLLIAFSGCYIAAGVRVFEQNTVRIKSGSPDCVSQECTPTTDPVPTCTVDDCENVPTSTAAGQDVEIVDVYLEKFTSNEDGAEKLALHLKWSPNANATNENLKGFKIEITDSKTGRLYSKCYHIDRAENLYPLKESIFHYDCFGKKEGEITLSSNITVSILTLPLSQNPISQGTAIRVDVPDCSNEELHSLTVCVIPGGRPTRRPCVNNCTSVSVIDGQHHIVQCKVTGPPLWTPLGKCINDRAVNKTGKPSAPSRLAVPGQEWYKYIDPVTGDVKLALNFTWKPSSDSSIKDLTGYEVQVHPEGSDAHRQCFEINTDLSSRHNKALFYYDCFGRGSNTPEVKPGKSYSAMVHSVPFNSVWTHISVAIPTCAAKELQDVTACIEDSNRRLNIIVNELFCANRTLKVDYLATPEYGSTFKIVFCEGVWEDRDRCTVVLKHLQTKSRSGSYYFSLPSSANLSVGYKVYIEAKDYDVRTYSRANFQVCVTPLTAGMTVLIVVICVFVVLVVAFLVWYVCFRHRCGIWIFKKKLLRPEYHFSARNPPADAEDLPVEMPRGAKVYVVFADDHDLHRNAVHWFCSFLQRDLGVTVKTHIWEANTMARSRPEYILNNLQNSDKVLVICSEGSKHCLQDKEADNMYTPVIRQLCADSLAARNPEKYIIAHFDYSKAECIPDVLQNHMKNYVPAFKLMDQLEELYFKLLGLEQYQERGIVKIVEIADYFDAEKRSESALKLQRALSKMAELTRINPNWYQDSRDQTKPAETAQKATHTNTGAGDAAVPSYYDSIADFDATDSSIAHLISSPPPKLEHTNGKCKYPAASQRDAPQKRDYAHAEQNRRQNTNVVPRHDDANGSVGYRARDDAVRMAPPARMPTEHQSRRPHEHDMSPVSVDASFEISESEDLSSVLSSAAPSKAAPDDSKKRGYARQNPGPAKSFDSLTDNDVSYRPESFKTADFEVADEVENGYDSRVLTFLPSTSTQATDIDETSIQYKSNEVDQLMSRPVIRKPSAATSPESGLFTLAVVDEEDDADLEDQIKSINMSGVF